MIIIVNLYIYSVLITLTVFVLIWTLYKTNEELANFKKAIQKQIDYNLTICRGCGDYYEGQIKQYEEQINEDTDLIDKLRKDNWNLKNDR